MPRIAEESIRRVAESSDIVEVIGSYIQLKRAGTAYKALCPFHKEKTPSFTVSPARQQFHCFGCGAGGSVIRFVMDYEQLPFAEAVRKLAHRAGIPLIEESAQSEDGASQSQRARLLEIHREAAAWFHHQLLKEPGAQAARSYLRDRGIDAEIAKRWKLGVAPEQPGVFLKSFLEKGFREGDLVDGGLCGKSEEGGRRVYERFRGRLMIPIFNDYGEVVGFSGRILDAEKSPAKYVNSPETPIFSKGRLLFGLNQSKRSLMEQGVAIVCEGQFDLITAFEHGVKNVIAPQGTAFTPQQAALLKRFVPKVILCFDADQAGMKAIERSLPALLGCGLAVQVIEMATGDDPDSLIRREGAEAFIARANGAKDILDYLFEKAASLGALNDPRGVAETSRRLAGVIRLFPDLVQRDAAVNMVSARMGIAPTRIEELVRTARAARDAHLPAEDAEGDRMPQEVETLPEAIAFLCRLALGSAEAKKWLREQSPEHLGEDSPAVHLLWKTIRGDFDPAKGFSVAAFLATCSSAEESALVALDSRPLPADPMVSVRATWLGLRRQSLEKQRDATKAKLRQKGISPETILQVQKELLDLQKSLNEVASPDFYETRA